MSVSRVAKSLLRSRITQPFGITGTGNPHLSAPAYILTHMKKRELLNSEGKLLGSATTPGKVSKRAVRLTSACLLALGSILLTSCGGKPVALPDPDIKIYLLDLSSSGDVENQFRLIQGDLTQDMTSKSLGSPYDAEGPSLTKFYFVGTNSRALREFTLQDQQIVYDLFQYIDEENNNTRTEKFWRLLSEKYQNYIIQKLDSGESVGKEQCLADFNEIFIPTWSLERVRQVYASFMCRMAVYSLSNFEELQNYIQTESKPGVQKASDVFGALSKIGSQVEKFHIEYPSSKIKVTLATDGDHNLGSNSPSNLRARIQSASNICALSDEYRKEFELGSLTASKTLEIDPRGISALTNGTGEYPRQLESFWNCFFPNK